MAEQTEDEPRNSTADDHERSALPNQQDSMAPLFEEEPEDQGSATGKEDTRPIPDPKQSTDTVDAPDIQAGALDSLKAFLVEEGKQDTLPDIRNTIADASEQQESPEKILNQDTVDNENISKSANIIDSLTIPSQTYALGDKPEIATEGKMSGVLPEEPDGFSTLRLRLGLVMFFALIGMAGFAAVLWMNFTLANRIDRIGIQLSVSQKKITSINGRINQLEAIVSSRKADISGSAQPVSRKVPTVMLPDQSLPPSPSNY